MSTETKRSTPFAFTTHDGTDENGVRAEVFVQVNKGIVKEIKENSTKEVADVHFGVNGLKFPIHGWIRTDEPVFELVKTAHAAGDEVEFRIETQRKAAVARTTPMEELRVDSATARDNVKVILVAINGVLSGEAVTNPNEDPRGVGGRYPASDSDRPAAAGGSGNAVAGPSVEDLLARLREASSNPAVRHSVLDALAAHALASGVSVDDVNEALAGKDKRDNTQPEPRQSFSLEAPSWKEYNSDGRLNLGSSVIAAGVGIETLVHDRISTLANENNVNATQLTNLNDAVEYYTRILFAIADRIQVASYGEGSRVDRAAASHVRIRGIVYEIVKKTFPLPITFENNTVRLDAADARNWIASVGKEGIARFARAIKSALTVEPFGAIGIPATLTGGSKPVEAPASAAPAQAPQTAPVATQSAPEPVVEAKAEPVVEAPVVEAKPEPVAEVPVVQAPVVETEEEEEVPSIEETPATEIPVVASAAGVLEPHLLEAADIEGEELASEELVTRFKTLFAESGFNIQDKGDQIRIARLLGYTYGEAYTNVKKLPEFIVEEFIDWYEANGAEALHNAVALATERA